MRIRINNETEIYTGDNMVEIAKKIANKEIDCNPKNSIINWGQVWNVLLIEES